MRVLFYTLFYMIMCNAITNPISESDKIFNQELNEVEEQGEPTATSFDNSRMRNVLEDERKTERQNLKKFSQKSLLNPSAKDEEKLKRVLRQSTSPEYPSRPFYLLRNPEHVGDGARLRLDFVRPCGSNGSCQNFRGSAEVVAGQWRLPAGEHPPVFDRSKNWGDDSEPRLSTGDVNPREAETRGTKKPGFFKSVGDFFKHSFHIDKTTSPIPSTTSKTPRIDPPEVSHKVFSQRRDRVFQGHEDLGKGVSTFFKNRKPFKGRDATFNLRIKAVAVPRLPGIRKAGS